MFTDPFRDLAEQKIREAIARGEFDNLPGAGKPIDTEVSTDPDWWIKWKLMEEDSDLSALVPTRLQLRREREKLMESIAEMPSEQTVREAVKQFNSVIREELVRPIPRGMPVIVVTTIDEDEAVARWQVETR